MIEKKNTGIYPSDNNMKEKLTDIVENLISCAKARKGLGISPAARVHCVYDGEDKVFWFTNGLYPYYRYPEVAKFGIFVPKNRDIAIKIQTSDIGTSFEYLHLNNIKRKVTSWVYLENRTDLQNQTIAIAGDSLLYQYRNLDEFLATLRQNQEEIVETEAVIQELRHQIEELKQRKGNAQEQAKLKRSVSEYERRYRILTEQQEDLKNITIYIRKQGEMRYSQIVDPIQTGLKAMHLYDGTTLIIEGGPGTGKSTTMIHRLAYLTDIGAIDEDEKDKIFKFKLNSLQRRQLREAISNQHDWLFFSPSQLLKEYLADAMNKEGLKNTSEKVWNWRDYRTLILQENYKLLGTPASKAPFKASHLKGTLFYQNSGVVSAFAEFYLGELRTINAKLPALDAEGENYAWTSIAKSITNRLEGTETYSLAQFVSLFNSLESVYGNDCKTLLSERNSVIEDLTDDICSLLDSNKDARTEIEDLMDLPSESEEADDEEDEETAAAEEEKGREGNEDQRASGILGWLRSFGTKTEKKSEQSVDDPLKGEIKKWLKAFCNSKNGNGAALSDLHQLMTETLIPIIEGKYDSQIKKICELMVFEQFAQYTRGVKAIMLNGMPARYRKFRTHLMKVQFEGCNLKLLRELRQRNQGKELHHQEQSLLLGFINTLVKQILSANIRTASHTFIDAYNEVARPIIGIDEATDFSACDIYAMQSLLTRDFYSLTLCGDMMQRMTDDGIKEWKELDGIVPNPVVKQLKTSYRQSKKMLEVARQMHKDTRGTNPVYRAFMQSNKVPPPLLYVSDNELDKIDWISKRLSEVYKAYGELLPSIAIFVNDKGYIPKFIDRLQNTDFFKEKKVAVLDGINENKRDVEKHICVYPIDTVKGMEFDVVFFHNIDNSYVDTDLLKRYIYVGVSRAAFFLGVTLLEKNEAISRYFVQNKDWFKI